MVDIGIENNKLLEEQLQIYKQKNKDLKDILKIHTDRGKELNELVGSQGDLLDAVSVPLAEYGLDFKEVVEVAKKIEVNVFSLIRVQHPPISVYTLLGKIGFISKKQFNSSRSMVSFAKEMGLLDNPFFMTRVARTSVGKEKKSATTILFSLLGVMELLFLIKKQDEKDESFLENYYWTASKKRRVVLDEAIDGVNKGDVVEFDVEQGKFI